MLILTGLVAVSSVPSITQNPLSTRLVSAKTPRPAIVQIPKRITTPRHGKRQTRVKSTRHHTPIFPYCQSLSRSWSRQGRRPSRLQVGQQLQGDLVIGIRLQRFFVSRVRGCQISLLFANLPQNSVANAQIHAEANVPFALGNTIDLTA